MYIPRRRMMDDYSLLNIISYRGSIIMNIIKTEIYIAIISINIFISIFIYNILAYIIYNMYNCIRINVDYNEKETRGNIRKK